MSIIRVGIIGCGAIAERIYLPAFQKRQDADIVALIDLDIERARRLSEEFSIPHFFKDHQEALGLIDGAIVCVPHKFHAHVSELLLDAGVHVLVEKPMAFHSEDCRQMIEAADNNDRVLQIGLMRRFKWSVLYARDYVRAGALGTLRQVNAWEGRPFNWPVASISAFSPEQSGGGVLADTGAHTLDVVLTICGEPKRYECLDDAEGGVESESLVNMEWADGCQGRMELSRNRRLSNCVEMIGDRGQMVIGLDDNSVHLFNGESRIHMHGQATDIESELDEQKYDDLFVPQIDNWLDSIKGEAEPVVDGEAGRVSVEAIEKCYQARSKLEFPWEDTNPNAQSARALEQLRDKNVLITGATGFIGGRLVDFLRGYAKRIVLPYRRHASLSRLARFSDLKFVHGELRSPSLWQEALEDVDVVFHLAHDFVPEDGSSQKTCNMSIAEVIIDACSNFDVGRLVYMSSFSAYGDTVSRKLNENSSKMPEDAYGQAKQAIEAYVLDRSLQKKLACIALQPSIVYGPYSKPWTIAPASQMSQGRIVMPASSGAINFVYVDDVIQALLLAATTSNEAAHGKSYLIAGDKSTDWMAYYRSIEKALSVQGLVCREVEAIKAESDGGSPFSMKRLMLSLFRNQAFWDEVAKSRVAYAAMNIVEKVARRELKSKLHKSIYKSGGRSDAEKYFYPSEGRLKLLNADIDIDITNARKLLDYHPEYSIDRGLEISNQFARWYVGEAP